MLHIEKTRREDFERIYPLLLDFNHTIDKERWRNIFVNHWNTEEDYCGFSLLDNEKIVGFLGLIFSKRLIGNQYIKFCNLTSWVVKNEYRKHSLTLIYPVLELKDYTLIDLTPNKNVYEILRFFGFQPLNSEIIILPPFINLHFNERYCEFISDHFEPYLSENELRVHKDHLHFQCSHLLLKAVNGNCYIIYAKYYRKKMPLVFIHYLSNLGVFLECIKKTRPALFKHLGVLALSIDERLLKGRKVNFAITRRLPFPRLFYSKKVSRFDIDNIYSELILLNI